MYSHSGIISQDGSLHDSDPKLLQKTSDAHWATSIPTSNSRTVPRVEAGVAQRVTAAGEDYRPVGQVGS